ncbi:MAG: ribosome silencing factor [Acidimicrobiia bacterium]
MSSTYLSSWATISRPGRVEPIALHKDTSEAAEAAASAVDDKKGLDVALLDVSSVIVLTDVFVIATGTSRRHVLSLAEEVEARLAALDRKPLRREGLEDAGWVLLDFGDIVVHLFDAETRRYYDLERLWRDAPRLAFQAAAG